MTGSIILECKVGLDEVWIEHHPGTRLPFMLDCGYNRRGSKQFGELPRLYKTLAAAKAGATKYIGRLDWVEPASR